MPTNSTDEILRQALHACADATEKLVPGQGRQVKDFADELYGRLSGPRPAPEWRPIETAPRDGTVILAFWESNGAPVAACYGVTRYEGEWLNPEDNDDTYCEPTHWQPLPDPPTVKGVRGIEDDMGNQTGIHDTDTCFCDMCVWASEAEKRHIEVEATGNPEGLVVMEDREHVPCENSNAVAAD